VTDPQSIIFNFTNLYSDSLLSAFFYSCNSELILDIRQHITACNLHDTTTLRTPYSNNNTVNKMVTIAERKRPLHVVAVCFLLLVCSQTLECATAITSWKSTTAAARFTNNPSENRLSTIARGGSLDESNKDGEDGDDVEGSLDAVTTATAEEEDAETSTTEITKESGGKDSDCIVDEDEEVNSDDEDESLSSSLIEIATTLRLEGKKYHDEGDFIKAAEVFQKAADTLLKGDGDNTKSSEDYATCRLHQALCHLKSKNYELCIDACTDVLQESDNLTAGGSTHLPAINARAYHRRAKAKMALGDNSGALQDARTASFLGDGKAVALYGKLMRESSSTDLSSAINPLLSPDSSSVSPHAALLESLMNKSGSGNGSAGAGGLPDFSPASLLMGSGSGGNSMLGALGSGGGGLAKSVVQNLLKKMDDESTHETICSFLQQTSTAQIKNLASMAGINNPLQDSQLDKLVNFCHGITPKGIRRTVGATKVMVYFGKLIRRTIQLINKYKSLLAAIFILQWAKSSIFRPIPINKGAAKKAAKKAIKEAMKASRAGFF
jgi:tetratricopeptide (TPR) repeat protein